MKKLLADELNLVFGDSERECTLEDVAKLNYTECCIKESMRLYPSTPFISRTISEDIEIGKFTYLTYLLYNSVILISLFVCENWKGGYLLPAGISVLVNIYGVHRSPSQYSNPEVYLPERFLPENSIGRHRFAFLPFSAGPRNCIGRIVQIILTFNSTLFWFFITSRSKIRLAWNESFCVNTFAPLSVLFG